MKTNLKDGLTKMWKWAKLQPIKPIIEWDDFELDIGLYSYWKK